MIKALPSMESTFTVSIKGTETAQQFDGTFTYKRPNLRVKSEIAKTTAILDSGLKNLDEDTKFLHNILATLKHTIIKSPDWWDKADFGFELYDVNVVFEVYKACSDFEQKWVSEVWMDKKEEPAKQAK